MYSFLTVAERLTCERQGVMHAREISASQMIALPSTLLPPSLPWPHLGTSRQGPIHLSFSLRSLSPLRHPRALESQWFHKLCLYPELFSKLRTHVFKSGDKLVGRWLSLLLRGTLTGVSPPEFLRGCEDLGLSLFAYLFPSWQLFPGQTLVRSTLLTCPSYSFLLEHSTSLISLPSSGYEYDPSLEMHLKCFSEKSFFLVQSRIISSLLELPGVCVAQMTPGSGT